MFPQVSIDQLVANGYVAPHPVTARNRISDRYSCALTLSGRECQGIEFLRDLIESIDPDTKFARCLVLFASHTHWDDEKIVESFDSTRDVFLNGPLDQASELRPISFVFSSEGPIPFEWADESVDMDSSALAEIYEFVRELNGLVVSRLSEELPIPIGISIDHRFKKSIWDDRLFGYAEGYHVEENGRAVVRPVLDSIIKPQNQNPDQVQVTWNCFPNHAIAANELTEYEEDVLRELENTLSDMTPSQALGFVTSLQSELESEKNSVSE